MFFYALVYAPKSMWEPRPRLGYIQHTQKHSSMQQDVFVKDKIVRVQTRFKMDNILESWRLLWI